MRSPVGKQKGRSDSTFSSSIGSQIIPPDERRVTCAGTDFMSHVAGDSIVLRISVPTRSAPEAAQRCICLEGKTSDGEAPSTQSQACNRPREAGYPGVSRTGRACRIPCARSGSDRAASGGGKKNPGAAGQTRHGVRPPAGTPDMPPGPTTLGVSHCPSIQNRRSPIARASELELPYL